MFIFRKLTFLTVTCALAFGCTNPPPESRYDKIAAGFCECTTQLVTLNNAAAAMADDTTGKAADIFRQMQTEYVKAQECSASIVAQFGKLKTAEFPQLEKALTGKCPDLATQRDLLVEMLGE